MSSPPQHLVQLIVSGGQAGADRAALDAAIALGIEHGGWCPLERLAEDGPIPEVYQLKEMRSALYPVRSQQNVIDSDGTLILYRGELRGGAKLTHRLAVQFDKPHLLVDLEASPDVAIVHSWLAEHNISVLNITGPRASAAPGITQQVREFVEAVFAPA